MLNNNFYLAKYLNLCEHRKTIFYDLNVLVHLNNHMLKLIIMFNNYIFSYTIFNNHMLNNPMVTKHLLNNHMVKCTNTLLCIYILRLLILYLNVLVNYYL